MEHPRSSSTTTIEVDGEGRSRKRSHNEMHGGQEYERRREDSAAWLPGPSNPHVSEHGAVLREILRQKHDHQSRETFSQQPSSSSNRPPPTFDNTQSHAHPPTRPERSQVDLRRPVMPSSFSANIIDLTEDGTPPRPSGPFRLRLPSPRRHGHFEPEVITLDTGRPERRRSPPRRPSSPEIEFVSERTVARPERPTTVAQDEGGHAARRAAQPGTFGNLWNLLRANPTEEAMQTYAQEQADRNTRHDHARRERALAGIMREATAQRTFSRGRIVGDLLRLGGRIDAMDEDFDLADDIPMNIIMDYDATGFAMGPNGRRASPPYIEPSPPPKGFIKSTEEEDVVICPNCSDELGVGLDPLKRQVWVAKGCGHVYCGECTKNRPVKKGPKSQKLALKTKPFSKCVVEDCGKSVSAPKSMIPLYL